MATREGDHQDLELAGKLIYGTIPDLERQIREHEELLDRQSGGGKLVKDEVDEEDIAAVVSRWTGIPVWALSTKLA